MNRRYTAPVLAFVQAVNDNIRTCRFAQIFVFNENRTKSFFHIFICSFDVSVIGGCGLWYNPALCN